MSSTNRGAKRAENDFYETPAWAVDAVILHLPLSGPVLDPCAGRGAILSRFASPHGARRAIEINAELCSSLSAAGIEHFCGDALDYASDGFWMDHRNELVIMNPPFSKWQEFVCKAIDAQRPHRGTTAALLRLACMAGQKRRDWWRDNPADVYVLSRRPSFTGHGTDSADYAWFVWGPGPRGRWSVL